MLWWQRAMKAPSNSLSLVAGFQQSVICQTWTMNSMAWPTKCTLVLSSKSTSLGLTQNQSSRQNTRKSKLQSKGLVVIKGRSSSPDRLYILSLPCSWSKPWWIVWLPCQLVSQSSKWQANDSCHTRAFSIMFSSATHFSGPSTRMILTLFISFLLWHSIHAEVWLASSLATQSTPWWYQSVPSHRCTKNQSPMQLSWWR